MIDHINQEIDRRKFIAVDISNSLIVFVCGACQADNNFDDTNCIECGASI